MKVLLLNSGIGKRLAPLTNNIPKCLVKIRENDTILDHQLKNILKCGFKEFIITTGPFEETIRNHIEHYYPSIKIQYVNNPVYNKTNYIYSLYLAKDIINGDILYSHGDLIFSDNLVKLLLESKDENCVLVNKSIQPPEKDFKSIIFNDRIYKIGVNLRGDNTAFLAPLYKLSKGFILRWLQEIESFIENNRVNCYAEDALNEILDILILKPCYYNEFCVEIDDHEDLEGVKNYLNKNI
ncbi:MAG: phosphocholine cytidylyltransferase family protein [Candidatus Lokiarchaeota archaeon]|nr:phosphocholine cytidylyltransferase family protein [Candidatus Lokiarchaeota archaeon]